MAGRSKYETTTVIMNGDGTQLVDVVKGPRLPGVSHLFEDYRRYVGGIKARWRWEFVDWLVNNHGYRVDDAVEVVGIY